MGDECQVMMGDWEFLPRCHYGFNAREWEETVARFERAAAARNGSDSQADGPRVLVEIRNDWSASSFMHKVRVCERERESCVFECVRETSKERIHHYMENSVGLPVLKNGGVGHTSAK